MAKANAGRSKTVPKKPSHNDVKRQLIVAGKVLVAEGQDDFTRGHISFRLPDDPNLFFMKAHSIGLDEITMQNVLTIDLEGNVVAGTSMLENGAMTQLLAEAASDPAPEFPRADIEKLKHDIGQPEQFKINFD